MEFDVDAVVRSVRTGQVDEFAVLVRRYQRDVWMVAAAMLRDAHETEEVVQQVFVDAYLHLDQFQAGRDFGLWVKEIARNRVRQELRSRRRAAQRLERFARLQRQAVDETDEDLQAEALEILRKCKEGLAPHAVRALELRYDFAWSFEQIAAEFSRTVAATRQMLSRARLALRDCMQAQRQEI